MTITGTLDQAVLDLARLYVADDARETTVLGSLWSIAHDDTYTISQPIRDLALILATKVAGTGGEFPLDALLCDLDTNQGDNTDHRLCCDGTCPCCPPAGGSPFAHPMCDRCDQQPAESLSGYTAELLALVPSVLRSWLAGA
jgi:hypothetical protein